jgi:hypothetical protein
MIVRMILQKFLHLERKVKQKVTVLNSGRGGKDGKIKTVKGK